jgi:hypothetical protein
MSVLIDIATLDPNLEIILRAGDANQKDAARIFQDNYKAGAPLKIGLSILFRRHDPQHPRTPLAMIDLLTQDNPLPHKKVSWAKLSEIIAALASTGNGYALHLYSDPIQDLPDHHLLVVVQNNLEQNTLSDEAAQALKQIMTLEDNPHRISKP